MAAFIARENSTAAQPPTATQWSISALSAATDGGRSSGPEWNLASFSFRQLGLAGPRGSTWTTSGNHGRLWRGARRGKRCWRGGKSLPTTTPLAKEKKNLKTT